MTKWTILPAATLSVLLWTVAVRAGDGVLWRNQLDTGEERAAFTRAGVCQDPDGGVDGSGCLKFHSDAPNGNPVSCDLDPEAFRGKTVVLSGMVKGENLLPPANKYWGPKLTVYYRTAAGKENWTDCPKEYGSYDWKRVECTVRIPADAAQIKILAGIQRGAGTLRIDELAVREAESGKAAAADQSRYEHCIITGHTDRENAEYRPGEAMHFYFRLLDGDRPAKGNVRVVLAADDGRTQTWDTAISEQEPLHITTFLNQPGFVMIRAMLLDGQDRPVKRENQNGVLRDIQYGLAAGVTPDALRQGVPEPDDFDAFWAGQLRRLAAVPMKVQEKKLFKTTENSNIYDVKIACAGARPVSGYLAVPKNAKPASLPIHMHYDGYCVRSAQIVDSGKAIDFFVNAHGIENGREDAYYSALQKGELSGYGFDNGQNRSGESCYFNGMILRDLRALEYAKTLPEWNGRDIAISGGSQGGFQSVAVAALSPGVTSCDINIPWFCDLGGITKGRVRGWRPDYEPGLGYCDTVNFAKRIQCPVAITAGLSDWVCPPSGVWILYNNLKVPKRMTMKQGLDHAVYLGYDHGKAARAVYSAEKQ